MLVTDTSVPVQQTGIVMNQQLIGSSCERSTCVLSLPVPFFRQHVPDPCFILSIGVSEQKTVSLKLLK